MPNLLPTLQGPRLCLRHLRQSDAAAVFELFGDAAVTDWMAIDQRRDLVHAAELIAEIDALAKDDTLYQWGVARGDDRIVGTVTLASLDLENRRAEIGFAIAPAHQGKGYGLESASIALDHAFGALALHRVEADVDPRNAASIALLGRLGFEQEGHLRQRWRLNGEWQDSLLFGLLASAWKGSTGRSDGRW